MAVTIPRPDASDEEAMILDVVRTLVKERVEPRAAEIDAKSEYPHDIKQLFAENDLLGIPFPAAYGGLGGTFLTYVKVVEEVSKACASSALIIAVQELGALPILIGGSETQKHKYIPKLATGEWVAAYALTEPGSGSDAAGSMRTRARKDGDAWVLDGNKIWITQGNVADVVTRDAGIQRRQDREKDGNPGLADGRIAL
jgi:alkylation response protein AidB-like acyl-CoA dehydrogenase